MDDRNKRIEDKLDQIQTDMTHVKTHLAEYNVLLDVHIKRTESLEKRVKPLEDRNQRIIGVFGFIGLLAAIAAIVEVFIK